MSATLQALTQAYENAANPREQVEALLILCRFHSQGNHKQMLEHAEDALALARKARFRKGIADALMYIGRAHYLTGEYEQAVIRFCDAYKLFKAANNRDGIVQTLTLLAKAYRYNGFPDKAREALLEAEEAQQHVRDGKLIALFAEWAALYKSLGDPENVLHYSRMVLALAEELGQPAGVAEALHNLGFIALCFGDDQAGLDYCYQALDISRENGIVSIELEILQDIAGHYRDTGRLDLALDIAREYERRAEEIKAEIARVHAQMLLCSVYLGRQELDKALLHAKKMTRIARRYGVPAILNHASLIRADVHAAAAQLNEATHWYSRALNFGQETGSIPDIHRACKGLAEMYERKGDLETAYQYYRRFMDCHEQLLGFMKAKAVASAVIAARVEQAERERDRLHSQMQSLETKIERKQQELTASTLLIAKRDELLEDLQAELRGLLAVSPDQSQQALSAIISRLGRSYSPPQAWEEFSRQFQMTDPGFTKSLTERFGHLTPTELKVCSLLRVNLSTKDIASLLSVQPASVDIYRSAIRKKFGLPKGANLTSFLGSL